MYNWVDVGGWVYNWVDVGGWVIVLLGGCFIELLWVF